MTTIHELRVALEQAQAAYLAADIEHPTASILAKEALTNARFNYWGACADLVTRLPGLILDNIGTGDPVEMAGVYEETTGESL